MNEFGWHISVANTIQNSDNSLSIYSLSSNQLKNNLDYGVLFKIEIPFIGSEQKN